MADAAPTGGGGNAWTAIEVILVIILGFALLARITGQPLTPIVRTDDSATKTKTTPGCGIILSRPKPLEMINGFVSVTGSVSGCAAINGTTLGLTAVVIGQDGQALSETIAIAPQSSFGSSAMLFSATVTLTRPPQQKTGYLIVVPTSSSDTVITGARTPITFSK